MGVFSEGKRRVFVGKKIKNIRYFSDLRVPPTAQGSRILYEVTRFITENNILEVGVALIIVFAENKVMLGLINRHQHGAKKLSIFKYFSAGSYLSYMVKFSSTRKIKGPHLINQATKEDVPAMQKLLSAEGPKKLFFPYYDFTLPSKTYYAGLTIEDYYDAFSEEELVGIVGVRDQHQIKQTRITGYSRWVGVLRPLVTFLIL